AHTVLSTFPYTTLFRSKSMLDVLKCPVTIAGTGKEAIELTRQQEFDLILMDCQMPGMDGFEVTREVRKQLKKHVPIIAMTANAIDRKSTRLNSSHVKIS